MDRNEINRILRCAGFEWQRIPHVIEDAYTRWIEYEWVLRDRATATAHYYGDEMTIRQAMERGAARGYVACQQWLDAASATEGTDNPSARERWVRGPVIPAGADERRYLEA